MVYTIDGEQLTRRKLVTIDGSQVTTQTGIPLALNIVLPNVKAAGADVRLAKLDGAPIAREIECIDVPSNDAIMLHYPFDTTDGENSQFYVYWGNASLSEPAADSTYGSEAVWDSNYKAVYHMNNDPTGGSGSIKDSTANDRHGTPSGTFVSGDLVNTNYGKGIDFLTASVQSIILPNGIYSSAYSVEMVVTFDDVALDYHTVYGEGNSGTDTPVFVLAPRTTNGTFGVTLRNNANSFLLQAESTITHASDEEITVAWTDSSGAGKLFRNGVEDATNFSYTPSATTLNTFRLGLTKRTDSIWMLDGTISEIRLSDITRTDNFVKTSQKNLNNPTASGTDPFYKLISTPQHQRRTPQFIN